MATESDDADWARTHRACFEVGPLVEQRAGERVHVGYTIHLYAAAPLDKAAGTERDQEWTRIWGRLRSFVESLRPAEDAGVRLEVEAMRPAAYLRPENKLEPEVGFRARVFHGDRYFNPVTDDERTRMSAVERKLAAMGLRAGHW